VQWYADFQQLPFFLSSGFNFFQEEFFLSGSNPQHIRSLSEVEATTMQQSGAGQGGGSLHVSKTATGHHIYHHSTQPW